jgi:hypothetical protein
MGERLLTTGVLTTSHATRGKQMELIKAGLGFDNTARIKAEAESIILPPTPKGKQVFQFRVGQRIEHNGQGKIKEGVQGKIAIRYKDHGFCYYVLEGSDMVHRQQDLRRGP